MKFNYCGWGAETVWVDPDKGDGYLNSLICRRQVTKNGKPFEFTAVQFRLGYLFIRISKDFWKTKSKTFYAVSAVVLFYLFCLNYLTVNQIGLEKNVLTGNVTVQDRAGWHLTHPFILVVRIDTRPVRVGVHSSGRCANAKLVKFLPEYWLDFVKTEGWRYYWWSNRLSYNVSYPEEYRGWRDVMRGYAYSAKRYPFIEVVEEYEEVK